MTKEKVIDLNSIVDEIVKVRDIKSEEYLNQKERFYFLLRQLKDQIEKLCYQTENHHVGSVYPKYPVLEEFKKLGYHDYVYLPVIDMYGAFKLGGYGYSENDGGYMYGGTDQKDLFDRYYLRYTKYINKQFMEILLKGILEESKRTTRSRLNELETIRQTIKNIDELGVS